LKSEMENPNIRRILRVGSRGSQLALWQARHIATQLNEAGVETQIEIIKTSGDKLPTVALTQAGGKGLFIKELEEALLAGTIDLAVHSLKDVPTELPEGLTIAAIPEREDPRDAILGSRLEDLRPGARLGTSSGRRRAQLLALRPDVEVEDIRGNIDTRIRKLKAGQYDGIVLAVAGLRRLNLGAEIAQIFSVSEICPAAGQGALAVETRVDDPAAEICSRLDHTPTRYAVTCERTILKELGAGCHLPVGAFAEVTKERLRATALIIAQDGSHRVKTSAEGPALAPEELGRQLARDLIARGGRDLLSQGE
jgi:hydroxymethylbilane synthase